MISLPYTRKSRGSGHWSCNTALQLTKEVPIIFHNLKAHDSYSSW